LKSKDTQFAAVKLPKCLYIHFCIHMHFCFHNHICLPHILTYIHVYLYVHAHIFPFPYVFLCSYANSLHFIPTQSLLFYAFSTLFYPCPGPPHPSKYVNISIYMCVCIFFYMCVCISMHIQIIKQINIFSNEHKNKCIKE